MSDRLVLAMDGSTDVCCCTLLDGSAGAEGGAGGVVAGRSAVNGRGQARILLGQVDDMLREMGAGPSDLTRIFVGTGPGTFTGVRIAVATARGLSLALGIPVFGASTLSCLVAGALESVSELDRSVWSRVVSVVDARRGQVFYAVYEAHEEGGSAEDRRWVRSRPIQVTDRGALGERLRESRPAGTTVVVGDGDVIGPVPKGAQLFAGGVRSEYLVLGQRRLTEAFRSDAVSTHAGASGTGVDIGTPESVTPIYVRAPDADVHITKMRDPWVRDSPRS